MQKPLVLTFDCGTQSVRALIFNSTGELLCKHQVHYEPYISVNPGWAEQEPDFYFEKLAEASRGLKADAPEEFSRIGAVTLTTMRDTAVSLDDTLTPLRPSILWCDQRKAKCDYPLPLHCAAAFKLVGMTECVEASRRGSKSNWIRENQPEIWEKTYKYVMLSCYLTYRLTGRLVDSVANQVGHIPLDYKNKRWMKPSDLKFCVFNIETDKLPPLVQPGSAIGGITAEAAELTGIPEGMQLIATGSDKGCETLGTGCLDEKLASISFGTTSTIQLVTEKYVEPQQFLPAYPSLLKNNYNPEVEIYRGYWMISWFKNEFAAVERELADKLGISAEVILDKRLNDIPPGSEGLLLQPYWGAGLKIPEAKGVVLGFSDVHTRAHFYRAIIEGINYALRDGFETVSKRAGTEARAMTVSGGGSQSDTICQITADMFGKDVLRAQTYETAGLGSSIMGFVGMGVFNSVEDAVAHMVRHTSVFKPTLEGFTVYDKIYREIYQQVYHRVRPLYQKMRRIYADYGIAD